MFKKIVSNLPFHPAVLEQVSFYLRRLRQEDSIRRAGLVLTALVIALQVFMVISPSKPSLATSNNDIVYGARSKEQVLQAYNNNRDGLGRTDIQAIFNYFGIGSSQIAASEYQRIGSHQKKFISTGRGTSPGVDTFINIAGAQNGGIYQRPLTSWDTNGRENWYDSISGISTYGFRFWILTSGCGNIVFEENTPTPNLNIVKKLTSNETVSVGDTVTYSIQFQNTGPGTARNVVISDNLASEFSYVSYTSNIDLIVSQSGQALTWKIANNNSELPPSARWYNINIIVKLSHIINTDKVCNASSISASGITTKQTEASCINTIQKPDQPEARLSTDKTVENITQNISDANDTTASPGDKLRYTILITNSGDADYKNLKLDGDFGESINDILEYSTLVDQSDARYNDSTHFLSWDAIDIPAGTTIKKSFIVQVMDPLPTTPISASDPLSYDFNMQNKYGRLVVVHLNKPVTKTIEQTVKELPNTGPGTSLTISVIAAVIIGYFFFRGRLLSRELEVVHHSYSAGGL